MRNFILLIVTLAVPVFLGFPDQVKLWWGTREGVSHFQAERTFEAFRKFLSIVEDFPKLSLTHFNLAATFDKNEDGPKADSEYLTAIALNSDPVSVFSANFNLAVRKTKEKKINEALEKYQAALAIAPDSKEVKTNIELLFKSNQGGGGEGDQQQDDKENDGKGDKKDQKPKEGEGKDKDKDKDKKDSPAPKFDENRKKMPKPFKSEEVSKQDMERILDELKRQENQIRGRMHQEQKSEEKSVEKDW